MLKTTLRGLHEYTVKTLSESSDKVIIFNEYTTFLFNNYGNAMDFSRAAYNIGITYLSITSFSGIPNENHDY